MDLLPREVHLDNIYTMAAKKGTLLEDVKSTLDKDAQDLLEFCIFVFCVSQANVTLSMSDFIDRHNKIVKEIYRQNEGAFILYGSVLSLRKSPDFQRLAHAKNRGMRV